MTPEFHALWMLCALGATSFAAAAAARPRRVVAILAGVGLAALVATPAGLPDAVLVASGVVIVAGLQLYRPQWGAVTAFAAGVLAAVWAVLMHAQGIPVPVSLMVGAALPLLSLYLAARRSSFAPPALREDATLLMLFAGIVVAVAPGVLDGWRAALNLNIADQGSTASPIPGWTAILGAASMVGGGLYSLWSRR